MTMSAAELKIDISISHDYTPDKAETKSECKWLLQKRNPKMTQIFYHQPSTATLSKKTPTEIVQNPRYEKDDQKL